MESARSISYAVDVEVVPTDYGFAYAGIRRMAEGTDYVRAYHLIMPFHQYRPLLFNAESENRPRVNSHIWVPMDDETTMVLETSPGRTVQSPCPRMRWRRRDRETRSERTWTPSRSGPTRTERTVG